jgi:hypothetical protein
MDEVRLATWQLLAFHKLSLSHFAFWFFPLYLRFLMQNRIEQ